MTKMHLQAYTVLMDEQLRAVSATKSSEVSIMRLLSVVIGACVLLLLVLYFLWFVFSLSLVFCPPTGFQVVPAGGIPPVFFFFFFFFLFFFFLSF